MVTVRQIINSVTKEPQANEPERLVKLRNFGLSLLGSNPSKSSYNREINEEEFFQLVLIVLTEKDKENTFHRGIHQLKKEISHDLFESAENLNNIGLLTFDNFKLLSACYQKGFITDASYAIVNLKCRYKLNHAAVKKVLSDPENIYQNLNKFFDPFYYSRFKEYDIDSYDSSDEEENEQPPVNNSRLAEPLAILKKYKINQPDLVEAITKIQYKSFVMLLIAVLDDLEKINRARVVYVINNEKHAKKVLMIIKYLDDNNAFHPDFIDSILQGADLMDEAYLAAMDLLTIKFLNTNTAKIIIEKPNNAQSFSKSCLLLYKDNLWQESIKNVMLKNPQLATELATVFFRLKGAKLIDEAVIAEIAGHPNDADQIANSHIVKHRKKFTANKKKPTTDLFNQSGVEITDSIIENLASASKFLCGGGSK